MSVCFMSVLHGSCLVVVLPASSLNLNNGPSFLCQCQKHVHVSSFFVCLSVCVISQSPGILAQSSSTHRRIVVGMCVFVPFHCSGSHYSIPRHEQGHKDVQAPWPLVGAPAPQRSSLALSASPAWARATKQLTAESWPDNNDHLTNCAFTIATPWVLPPAEERTLDYFLFGANEQKKWSALKSY